MSLDTPGGIVDKHSPANPEDVDLTPGLGRFHRLGSKEARMPQLLSPRSRASKSQLRSRVLLLPKPEGLEPVPHKRRRRSKKTPQLESGPALCKGRKPAQQPRPSAAESE